MQGPQALSPMLGLLSQKLAREIGLFFPSDRWHDLWRGLSGAGRELQVPDTALFVGQLLSSPIDRPTAKALARHLSIGETYFFRDPALFEALQTHVLPELIAARRETSKHLRLWSAGCASGEEAYSLAIMLHRMLPDIRDWNISILATDINPNALSQAEDGVYGEWSFRNAPPWLRTEYFTSAGTGRYRIREDLKRFVRFAWLNLAADGYPSAASETQALDLVLCRNVLMYFTPEVAQAAVRRYRQALAPNGWLAVGPTEISSLAFAELSPVHLHGAILHRKALPVAHAPSETAPSQASRLPTFAARSPNEEAAQSAYRSGRYRETVSLIGLQPSQIDEMTLLAHAHANLGELTSALHWCARAMNADALRPALHYLHGMILQELGRSHEAMLAFRHAQFLDPDFALAQFAMGRLMRDSGKPRAAERHFIAVLRILDRLATEALLPEGDGMTAGRLREIVIVALQREDQAA